MRSALWVAGLLVLITGCANAIPAPTHDVIGKASSSTNPARPKATSSPTLPPRATASPYPAATPTCEETVGEVETLTYPGVVIPQEIPVRVYTPPCYEASDQIAYPAVYLLHGYPFSDSQWDNLGADELADQEIANEVWPPFLMVMPLQPEPLFRGTDGGPGSYESELLEGLLPYIDNLYRTDPRPRSRALAGISRGGVWALEVAFSHPGTFNTVAALSPALAVNSPRPDYDPFVLVHSAPRLPERILLLAGEGDWAREETERLSEVLTTMDVEHSLTIVPGGHQIETWEAALESVLSFLVAGW